MAHVESPNISQRDGVTVITLGSAYENLDGTHLEELSKVILDVANTADPPRVVLDLSRTEFFGSSFIEVLFRAWNRLNAREKGRFAISGLTPYCREIIDTTHLDRLWKLYDTSDSAVAALGAGN
jgi:anti-anti-sigma factor